MTLIIVNPCASPLVLVNHSNTLVEAIQTLMSAGNPYPHSSNVRKRMRNGTFLHQLEFGYGFMSGLTQPAC